MGGKIASKSFGDLAKLRMGWDWETKAEEKKLKVEVGGAVAENETIVEEGRYPAGKSPFEKLPMELLGKFVFYITSAWRGITVLAHLCASLGRAAIMAQVGANLHVSHVV